MVGEGEREGEREEGILSVLCVRGVDWIVRTVAVNRLSVIGHVVGEEDLRCLEGGIWCSILWPVVSQTEGKQSKVITYLLPEDAESCEGELGEYLPVVVQKVVA